MFQVCPIAGKRAPELAAGEGSEHLKSALDDLMPLVLGACVLLSETERNQIIRDFTSACTYILTTLELKLAYWRTLPWLLCGVLHHNALKAMAAAKECIRLYDLLPTPDLHHRVSKEFLAGNSPHRPLMQALALGAPLYSLPRFFVARLLRLKFIPIVERIIESRHALVAQAVRKRRYGPMFVSLMSGRLHEFQVRLVQDPQLFHEVARIFDLIRHPKDLVNFFNIWTHPLAQERLITTIKPNSLFAVARDVVYHLSYQDQYFEFGVGRKQVAKEKLKEARQRKVLLALDGTRVQPSVQAELMSENEL